MQKSFPGCHRIAMVDDNSLYSKKLMEALRQKGANCVLYGPRHSPRSKSQGVMEIPERSAIRVWSQNRFPFQVFLRAVRDRPQFVHFQFEFYGIHSYGPLYSALWLPLALLFLRPLTIRTIVTLHMIFPRDKRLAVIRDTSPSTRRFPIILLAAFLIFWYKTVSILSHSLVVHANVFKNRLEEDYKVKPSRIAVIPHGVDTFGGGYEEPEVNLGPESKDMLYFGVISPRKGLETLIAAYALIVGKANCNLLLAGETPPYYKGYNDELKTFAERLELGPNLQFLGRVSAKDAHKLFRAARFVVLPYIYDMSASGSLSWALGHGVPVVASRTDYFGEELSHEKFGLLVPPGEPEALAKAMAKMLEEESMVRRFAERSRQVGLARSWSIIAARTLEFYGTLVSKP